MGIIENELRPFSNKTNILERISREVVEVQCSCGNVIKIPIDVITKEGERRLEQELEFIEMKLEYLDKIMEDTGISEYQRKKLFEAINNIGKEVKKHNLKVIK